MSKFNRIHLVVLDSVGIGAAPDANNFVNAGVPELKAIQQDMQQNWKKYPLVRIL